MKISTVIPILLLTCIFYVSSAYATETWHNGKIVLTSGEIVQGLLSYTDEIVQCNINHRIKAFSTRQVSHFQFYDPSLKANRTFVPVDNHLVNNVRQTAFYELVSKGVITLLRKEKYTYQLANDPYKERDLAWETRNLQRFQHNVHMRVQDFEYYYIYNKNLHPLKNFRKEINPLLQDHQATIAPFIQENSLNIREVESQVRIIDFYNRLCHEDNVAYRQ